jgi:integrase
MNNTINTTVTNNKMSNQEAIGRFKKSMEVNQIPSNTIRTYIFGVEEMLNFLNKHFSEVTMFDRDEFIMFQQSKGNVGTTINNKLTGATSFFKYLNEYHIFENNLRFKHMKDKDKRNRIVNRPHINHKDFQMVFNINYEYYKKHKKSFNNIKKILAMYLLMFGWMRKSEIINLKKEDISIVQKKTEDGVVKNLVKISIKEAKSKSGVRNIYINHGMDVWLNLWYDEYMKKYKAMEDSEYFLPTQTGVKTQVNQIDRFAQEMFKRAGIEQKFYPHEMRHLGITTSIKQGKDISWVSKKAGHSTPLITVSIYLHTNDEEMLDVDDMEGLIND